MGHYIYFIKTENIHLDLTIIEKGIQSIDINYIIKHTDSRNGELIYGSELFSLISIDFIGDPLEDEEIEEHIEDIEDNGKGDIERVLNKLHKIHSQVVVRVLWQGRDPDETLEKIDPLWNWLLGKIEFQKIDISRLEQIELLEIQLMFPSCHTGKICACTSKLNL